MFCKVLGSLQDLGTPVDAQTYPAMRLYFAF